MNLVAIAGLPTEATPRPFSRPVQSVGLVELDDKKAMWLSIAIFGAAAVIGYAVSEKFV